jgi:YQGE family putative transporter
MRTHHLSSQARLVLALNVLYAAADALCNLFVAVYFWINSLSFETVMVHYLAIYIVTPIVYVGASWFSQAHDRLYVYRLGLFLHAVYFGAFLLLREASADYAVHLGVLLGVTWGLFWAGNNCFNYDVTTRDNREYFFGGLSAAWGAARLVAPVVAGLVIQWAPRQGTGYQIIFALAAVIFGAGVALSFAMNHDRTRRPFHLRRALFPGKEHRDWRLVLWAAVTVAGGFQIVPVLLGLLMYMSTSRETDVGNFAGAQALVSILTAYVGGRFITRARRKGALLISALVLLAGGAVIVSGLSLAHIIAFGFFMSVAVPLFQIPHFSVRFEIIDHCMEHSYQRIEYLAAWEVPLAIGRVILIGLIVALYRFFGETGLSVALAVICCNHFVSYYLLAQTSVLRTPATTAR